MRRAVAEIARGHAEATVIRKREREREGGREKEGEREFKLLFHQMKIESSLERVNYRDRSRIHIGGTFGRYYSVGWSIRRSECARKADPVKFRGDAKFVFAGWFNINFAALANRELSISPSLTPFHSSLRECINKTFNIRDSDANGITRVKEIVKKKRRVREQKRGEIGE